MADGEGARAQRVHQDFSKKVRRIERTDAFIEGQDQDLFNTVAFHQGAALSGGTQQQRRTRGGQELGRMGIEGERRGASAALAGEVDDGAHELVVGGVHAVEIADGEGAGREYEAGLFEAAIDPHGVPLAIDDHLEAVVGQAHAGGQEALGTLVRQVVREVGEPGLTRLQPLDDLQALLDCAVGGMGLVAQCVEEQHVQVFQQSQGLLRHLAVVGQVGRVAKAEAVAGSASVEHRDGNDGEPGDLDGRAVEGVGADAGPGRLGFAGVEDVGEDAPDNRQRLLRSVNGNGLALKKIERTQVVETQDVVGVTVCKKHGVHAREGGAERLLPEIGPGVDDSAVRVPTQGNRGPETLVARVGRVADLARAADGRNAHACARAQNGDGQPLGRFRHCPSRLDLPPRPGQRATAGPRWRRCSPLSAFARFRRPGYSGSAVRSGCCRAGAAPPSTGCRAFSPVASPEDRWSAVPEAG